jgi:hypothetical protein
MIKDIKTIEVNFNRIKATIILIRTITINRTSPSGPTTKIIGGIVKTDTIITGATTKIIEITNNELLFAYFFN